MMPQRFHKQLKVFGKAELKRIPVRKPWNHAINLKKDFIPKKERTYLILREKKEKVRELMEKQSRKGYIRSSKLSQTLPVFFIRKKNKKKKIIQDYRYLNKRTVKNNYLLPLISDLINTIEIKKMFTKMDLCWGYNNIQIKERNK